jgi:hypothetical protein
MQEKACLLFEGDRGRCGGLMVVVVQRVALSLVGWPDDWWNTLLGAVSKAQKTW